MNLDWGVVATIAAPIITLFLGAALTRVLTEKAKLIAYIGHSSIHKLRVTEQNPQEGLVFTHSLVIKNDGRKVANNVRIGHFYLPINFNIYPPTDYKINEIPDTGPEITIPKVLPKEQITFSYLYYSPLSTHPINSYLKSDEGEAKIIPVIIQQQFPKWVGSGILVFAIIGFIAIIYVITAFFFLNHSAPQDQPVDSTTTSGSL